MALFPHRTVLRSLRRPLEATSIYGGGGAAVRGRPQPPRLVVMTGPRAGKVVALAGDHLTVGRGRDNDVVLPDIAVSRQHALLRRDGAGYLLLDRGSGNGTRVNGRGVDQARLRSGDEIVLGDSVVQFVEAGAVAVRGAATGTQAPDPAPWRRWPLDSRGAACACIVALLLAAFALGPWRTPAETAETGDTIRISVAGVLPEGASPEASRAPDAVLAADAVDPGVGASDPAASRREPEAPSREPRRPAAAARVRAAPPGAAPRIAEAYLAGDLATALERARAARAEPAAAAMLARLEQFASAWREGGERMREERSTDAIAAFERADAADRALAGGEGPLGREVRRALSAVHARAARAHDSDAEAGVAGAHLREALALDPANADAREQLTRLTARAGEAYLSGYVAKDTDPEAARRAFRLAVEALPATDATAVKARRWLDRLEGRPGEDRSPP